MATRIKPCQDDTHVSIDARSGELMLIALSLLVPSPKNARRTGGLGIDDLKASIKAQGLLHNLIVYPLPIKGRGAQRYGVVGGGRRLRALLALAAEGEIRRDEEILCRVKLTRDAAEASLAENIVREPMHPADEFEAFQRLVEEGNSVEDIAARFGTSPLTVRRRLKLADVHPELRQLYRDGGISLEQLMALALSDDADEQLALWNSTPTWTRDAYSLRGRLLSDEIDASVDAVAKFVGVEDYLAAGGPIRRDLFSEQGEGHLQDAGLLNRLAMQRLSACAEQVRPEGWAWVDVALRASSLELDKFGRAPKSRRAMTRAESKRHKALARERAALERQMDAAPDDDEGADYRRLDERRHEVLAELKSLEEDLATYEAEVMTHAGAIVCVGREGQLQVHRGLIRPEDRAASRACGSGEVSDGQEGHQAAPRVKPVHSAPLMQDMTAHRTLAARAAMLDRPDVALTALLHCLVQRLLGEHFANAPTAVRLVTNAPDAGLSGSTLGESRAANVLSQARERWVGRIPGDAEGLLAWLTGLAETEHMELLSLCVASSLNDVHQHERRGALDPICDMLGLDMADWWEAGQGTYFSRVSKEVILGAVTEGSGHDAAARYKGVTKRELARVAERDLAGRRWLPAPLRSAVPAAN